MTIRPANVFCGIGSGHVPTHVGDRRPNHALKATPRARPHPTEKYKQSF